MDEKVRKDVPNPRLEAGFFSKLFISWVAPLLKLGYKRPITEGDLYSSLPDEESEMLTDQLENEWAKETKKKKPSLSACFVRIYWWQVTYLGFICFIEEAIKTTIPLLIAQILKYFEGTRDIYDALLYSLLLCLGVTINCIIHHPYFLHVSRIGIKMRLAASGLIYKKALKLNLLGMDNYSGGQLINLISNDGTRLEFSVYFVPYLVVGPIQAVAITYIMARTIDVSILSGLAVLVVAIPTQSLLGKLFDRLRRITSKKCDKRINLLNEILNGIKIIKMYCWEEPFKKLINSFRDVELKYQKLLYAVSSLNTILDLTLPGLITFTSVTFFILFAKSPLTPSYIVLAMSFYMRISFSVGFFMVKAVTMLIGASVSIRRMEEFLLQSEVKRSNSLSKVNLPYVKVNNLNASWSKDPADCCLREINFEMYNKSLTAIVGSVGAGKSSLLMALLEELQKLSGTVDIQGSVFYVPQEPWIFTASLRQNITFGRPYNKEKFDKILQVCCLDQVRADIESFENGDRTLIGEKGINLSGGQRARVSVARALYSEAQIYLFDDPLSAVDANVAKNLFDNVINKFLRNKIRILVTHQIHFLTNADQIIYLEDGEMKFNGTYQALVNSQHNLVFNLASSRPRSRSHHSRQLSRTESLHSDVLAATEDMMNDSKSFLGSCRYLDTSVSTTALNKADLIVESTRDNEYDNKEYEEKHNFGIHSWATFFTYFRVGGGLFGASINFIIFVASQLLIVSADYWVSIWASRENSDMIVKLNSTHIDQDLLQHPTPEIEIFKDRHYYYSIYCILIGSAFAVACLRVILFFYLSTRSSRNLHKNMFTCVLTTPIRFFDVNPLGRIVNRFSKDMGQIDETIPITTLDFMNVVMMVFASVGMSVFLDGFVIIPLIPLTIIFLYVRKYFLTSSMEIKRIEGILRSPIFVHVNNILSGITTIRAANMETILRKEYFAQNNYHTRAVGAFMFINRWLGVRLDWVATAFVYIAVFSCIMLKELKFLDTDSGKAGLMFVYLVQLVGLFQWTIRQSCEVENLMTAVERVLEYTDLPTEPLEEGKIRPPDDNWPSAGGIAYEDVSFRYDKNLPPVLNELSFRISPGEKIGIVGRTGAGKSSIIQSLFRMAEPEGSIIIDDVETKDLSLRDLRSKLSIIPQEPTLFIGTIRSNLDPLNQYTDDVLWDALERVQLKDAVREMKEGLESEVQKAGSNLSVGQKQLICLARAIIKRSKILIIDEATANVDFKTDAQVQKSIRECFKDCTVLTIAHRLHTIIDSDRILCMNNGRIENFGRPYDMIMDETSLLSELLRSLEQTERERLIDMAKKSATDAANMSTSSTLSPNANSSSSSDSRNILESSPLTSDPEQNSHLSADDIEKQNLLPKF